MLDLDEKNSYETIEACCEIVKNKHFIGSTLSRMGPDLIVIGRNQAMTVEHGCRLCKC